MNVKTHRFNGVKYKLHIDAGLDGFCDHPKTEGIDKPYPGIWLTQKLPCGNEKGALNGLVSLIHECLHATKFPGNEKCIDRASTEIGRLLWRLGYRRKK